MKYLPIYHIPADDVTVGSCWQPCSQPLIHVSIILIECYETLSSSAECHLVVAISPPVFNT